MRTPQNAPARTYVQHGDQTWRLSPRDLGRLAAEVADSPTKALDRRTLERYARPMTRAPRPGPEVRVLDLFAWSAARWDEEARQARDQAVKAAVADPTAKDRARAYAQRQQASNRSAVRVWVPKGTERALRAFAKGLREETAEEGRDGH